MIYFLSFLVFYPQMLLTKRWTYLLVINTLLIWRSKIMFWMESEYFLAPFVSSFIDKNQAKIQIKFLSTLVWAWLRPRARALFIFAPPSLRSSSVTSFHCLSLFNSLEWLLRDTNQHSVSPPFVSVHIYNGSIFFNPQRHSRWAVLLGFPVYFCIFIINRLVRLYREREEQTSPSKW